MFRQVLLVTILTIFVSVLPSFAQDQTLDRARRGGVGKIMKLGFQPINWQAEFYGNAVYPSGGSSWTMRMQIAFLFPKLTHRGKEVDDGGTAQEARAGAVRKRPSRNEALIREATMIASFKKQFVACVLSLLLVVTMTREVGAQEQQAAPANSSGYRGQGTPLSTQELDSLVAPIALYPDALVAQILSAATYPDQVAAAEYWMQQNKNLTGSALGQAVNQQSWDPSVKALTQFPPVLSNMAQNISWTSQLGDAYHNQSQEVMAAVQTLRKQAQAAGNLKSTPQQTVTTQTQGNTQVIVIQPANPQIVYVPQYNPTVVYGTPYTTPGYSTGAVVATGRLSFGAGIAVGAMMSGGCCGWGYSSWNCNWYRGGAYYGGHPYYGNAVWHGGYYGGYNNYGYHSYNLDPS